jgi:hypothetical protein
MQVYAMLVVVLNMIAPKGTQNGPALYQYTDATAPRIGVHYRLRMVDGDGKEQVSKVIYLKSNN